MKLALVRQTYTPFGGAERFISQAIAALQAKGVAVEIIARNWQGELAGLRCDPFFLGRLWRDWGFARCVQKVISSARYDLVQSHERIPGCHIYRAGDGVHATWLELSGKPWRLSPWHRYTLTAEAALFRHPKLRAVICNSRMVAQDIAHRWPGVADKLAVIYNGIDLARFHPGMRKEFRHRVRAELGIAASERVILYVGSGYERKGVATLLHALPHLSSDTKVWIIGKDKEERRYHRLAARLGVADRARFFGPQADVRPYLASADLFCLPTRYDPLPNAALEALACGLPVVTTSDCGAAELITPGHNGEVLPAHAPNTEWAAALQRGLALSATATTVEAARCAVAALSYDAMAEQLLTLYASLGVKTPTPV